jgi:hypothetical protein
METINCKNDPRKGVTRFSALRRALEQPTGGIRFGAANSVRFSRVSSADDGMARWRRWRETRNFATFFHWRRHISAPRCAAADSLKTASWDGLRNEFHQSAASAHVAVLRTV